MLVGGMVVPRYVQYAGYGLGGLFLEIGGRLVGTVGGNKLIYLCCAFWRWMDRDCVSRRSRGRGWLLGLLYELPILKDPLRFVVYLPASPPPFPQPLIHTHPSHLVSTRHHNIPESPSHYHPSPQLPRVPSLFPSHPRRPPWKSLLSHNVTTNHTGA